MHFLLKVYALLLWVYSNVIFYILKWVDQTIDSTWGTVVFQYLALQIIAILVLSIIQEVIGEIRYRLKVFYNKLRRNKKLGIIRFLSELYYIYDKVLYKIQPRIYYKNQPSNNNRMDATNAYSILNVYENLIRFAVFIFRISIFNLISWYFIISYHQPTMMVEFLKFIFFHVHLYLAHFNLKTINELVSLATLISSVLVLFVLRRSQLTSKAKRKLYDEKYEKAIKLHVENLSALSKMIYFSRENIDHLSYIIDYIVDNFCKEIACNYGYELSNNKLINSKNNYNIYERAVSLFEYFNSFKLEADIIKKNMKLIKDENISDAYFIINKSLSYEKNILSLSPYSTKLWIETHLLDRDALEKTYKKFYR
ncbi:hypothetical protein [Fictibacillus sp. FJAT-27399]|uniref:hypothetical protein n=1 Tax=Fictibacillus sp. FJAT-27399 TaxID=1729689 RepID=UPI0007860727|nr:hypothetical protein [Fictibacillus sp. FJAT-27399]